MASKKTRTVDGLILEWASFGGAIVTSCRSRIGAGRSKSKQGWRVVGGSKLVFSTTERAVEFHKEWSKEV